MPEVVVLIVAGFQVPENPLFEIVAKLGAIEPKQISGIGINSGVAISEIETLKVANVAHCPAVGVKVYVSEVVLLIVAGFQVPIIPLFEIKDKVGETEPEQKSAIGLNKGISNGLTVIVSVVDGAH